MSSVHVGDVGTVFKITIKDQDGVIVNISTATVKKIIFKSPWAASIIKDGVFFTDGIDGILTYTTVATDIGSNGEWKIQAMVTLPTGTWYSEIGTFSVAENV